VRAAHQQITVEWWAGREAFELFVSDAVIEEMRVGDEAAARRRLAAAEGIARLATTLEAQALAKSLLKEAAFPAKAAIDAVQSPSRPSAQWSTS
jgi:hypothetical protein